MTPGMFHTFDDGARVTYSEAAAPDKRELARVFIATELQGRNVTIWAQQGTQYIDAITGSRFMLLRSGRRYEGVIGETPYRVVKFEKLAQRIERRDPDLATIEIDAQPTGLLANITHLVLADDIRSVATQGKLRIVHAAPATATASAPTAAFKELGS